MNTFTVKQVRRKAKALLRPKGSWIKGSYTDGVGCYCAAGAIAAAATGTAYGTYDNDPLVGKARRALSRAIREEFPSAKGIETWNDQKCRTKSQVLAAFTRAIKAAA